MNKQQTYLGLFALVELLKTEIVGKSQAAEEEQGKVDEGKRKNVEMEKATAESVRKRSIERLSETRERESNAEKAGKKQRMSPQSYALEYVREKSQKGI